MLFFCCSLQRQYFRNRMTLGKVSYVGSSTGDGVLDPTTHSIKLNLVLVFDLWGSLVSMTNINTARAISWS